MFQLLKYVWVALAVLAAGCSESDRENESPVSGGLPGVSGEVSEGMVPMLLDLCSNGRLTSAAGSQLHATFAYKKDDFQGSRPFYSYYSKNYLPMFI